MLPPALHSKIGDGLVLAASDMNTWMVTGGTNVGVMKLVGDIMHKASLKSPPPVIGIAALSGIAERSLIRSVGSKFVVDVVVVHLIIFLSWGFNYRLKIFCDIYFRSRPVSNLH